MKPILSRWLPVILWAIVIFFASANPDPYKSLPSRWTEPCFSTDIGSASCTELLGRVLHTTEYAIFAFLLARAMIWKEEIRLSTFFIVLLLSELYALSDETHQLFVPGRNFQSMDLGLDLLGGILGLSLYATCQKKRNTFWGSVQKNS